MGKLDVKIITFGLLHDETNRSNVLDQRSHSRTWKIEALILSDCGSPLVEFALVLPIMMLLITGLAAFGIAFNNYLVLTNAVGAAARAVALSPGMNSSGTSPDPCAAGYAALIGAAPTLSQSTLVQYLSIVVTPEGGGATTYSGTNAESCSGVTLANKTTAIVSAQYPAFPTQFKIVGWTENEFNLAASTSEFVQGTPSSGGS